MPKEGQGYDCQINGWTSTYRKNVLIAVSGYFGTAQSAIIRIGTHRECIRRLASLSDAEKEDFDMVYGNIVMASKLEKEIAAEKGAV